MNPPVGAPLLSIEKLSVYHGQFRALDGIVEITHIDHLKIDVRFALRIRVTGTR